MHIPSQQLPSSLLLNRMPDLILTGLQVMVDPDAPSPSDPNLREYLHW
jgi:hypothetical protein